MDFEHLYCPLTKEIFYKPVVASDGHIYEEEAIKKWVKNHSSSPLTRELISPSFQKVFLIEQQVSLFLEKNPEKIEEQYKPIVDLSEIFMFSSYEKFLKIYNFSFKTYFYEWEIFFRSKECFYKNISIETIQKHVIDHWENYEEEEENTGFTLLFLLCEHSYDSLIQYIITKGVNVNHCSKSGLTPLSIACKRTLAEIKILVENGANLGAKTNNGWKLIHYACKNNEEEIIQYLVEKGVDLEVEDKSKIRPIHIVCDHDHKNEKIIRFLVEKGVNLEAEDEDGWRPIHYLLRGKTDFKILEYFVEKGVNLEAEDEGGWRPIHYACRSQNLDIIRFLVEKEVNLEAEDEDGWRPIHYACRYNGFEEIKFLVDKGVNLEAEIEDGRKSIHFACRFQKLEIIKFLVDKGVNLEAEDEYGWRPIHIVCRFKHFKEIKYLVDQGVNLEVENKFLFRPIHCVCKYQSFKALQYLINRGVNYTKPSFLGTPIFIAFIRNKSSISYRYLKNKLNNIFPKLD